jgi:hypothetical protein
MKMMKTKRNRPSKIVKNKGELNMDKVKKRLQSELKQLQSKFNIGYELTIHYLPGQYRTGQNGTTISGEIINNTILIYDLDEESALKTLNHEFFEYMLVPIIDQYRKVINKLIETISQMLYDRREEVVNRLGRGWIKKH